MTLIGIFAHTFGDGDVMSPFVGLRGMLYSLFYVSFCLLALSNAYTVTRWARKYSRENTLLIGKALLIGSQQ